MGGDLPRGDISRMSGAHVRSTPVMTPTSSGTGLRRASGTRQERDSGMMELSTVRHTTKHFSRTTKWLETYHQGQSDNSQHYGVFIWTLVHVAFRALLLTSAPKGRLFCILFYLPIFPASLTSSSFFLWFVHLRVWCLTHRTISAQTLLLKVLT